jgi:alanine dehydrogenase
MDLNCEHAILFYLRRLVKGGRFIMIIGVPKEIKDNENRVALAPAGVQALQITGHRVFVESGAGLGSGFTDDVYVRAGAEIVDTAADVWSEADMVMKVKEPLAEEFQYFRKNLILFTYLHLAPEPELTEQLLEKGVTAIAYETIQTDNGALPLLTPMSEVAGRMSVQVGIQFLEKPQGGKGTLLGGVPGVPPGKVVIVGGGIVGTNSAQMALGMGAEVTILDVNIDRLRYLEHVLHGRLRTMASNQQNLADVVAESDVVIGGVLIPGAKAPKLVTKEMIASMNDGAVVVDVAIDQGGCIETARPTTHSDPTYVESGVVHYGVTNMPGAVPRTSTIASRSPILVPGPWVSVTPYPSGA